MENTPFDINALQKSQESFKGFQTQEDKIVGSMEDADRIRHSIPERKRIAELKEKQLNFIILALNNEGYNSEQVNEVLPKLSEELKKQLADIGASIAGEPPLEDIPELAREVPAQEEPPKSWRERYQEKYQMDPIKLSEASLAKALFQVKDYELMKMNPADAEEMDFALKEIGKGFSYSRFLLELFEVIVKQIYVMAPDRPIIDHIESNIYLTRFEATIRVIFEKQDPKLIKRYISCQSPVSQVIRGINGIKRRDQRQNIIDIIGQKCGKAYLKELLLNYREVSF